MSDQTIHNVTSHDWVIIEWIGEHRTVSASGLTWLEWHEELHELRAERDAQAAELARLRRLEEAASTMYYTNHGSPEWDTAYNMLMEAIDEREEAAREAEKARNGS